MNSLKKFFSSGLLILFPLFIIYYVFNEIIKMMEDFVQPISEILPPLFSHPKLISSIILIIFIIIIGLFAQLKIGKTFIEKIGQFVPGFSIIESIISEFTGTENGKKMQVCLLKQDTNFTFGFIIEDNVSGDGLITVFLPESPNPSGGTVFFVREENIIRINTTTKEVSKYMMRFGLGASDIVNKSVRP